MVDPTEHGNERNASADRTESAAARLGATSGDDSRSGLSEVRLDPARCLLQEAVFASRGGGSLVPASDDPARLGGCGLGAGPNLDVAVLGAGASDAARDAAALLWPDGLDVSRADRARLTIAGWVKRQDGLDRKRNHFIKDFRGEHGFDRTAYSEATRTAFEEGVEAVNQENRERQNGAARDLLAI